MAISMVTLTVPQPLAMIARPTAARQRSLRRQRPAHKTAVRKTAVRTTVLALVGAALLAVSACGPAATASSADVEPVTAAPSAPPSQPEPDRATSPVGTAATTEAARDIDVVVVGDSLTVSASAEITTALRNTGVSGVSVDAVEGRRIAADFDDHPSGLTAIEQIQNRRPAGTVDVWVIALGTNDVGADADADDIETAIDAVLRAVGSDRPVVWIDVYVEAKEDESGDFAVQVRRAAAERGDMVVADWFHPAHTDGALVGDGVHLTSAGRAGFATTVADAVARLVPAASATTS